MWAGEDKGGEQLWQGSPQPGFAMGWPLRMGMWHSQEGVPGHPVPPACSSHSTAPSTTRSISPLRGARQHVQDPALLPCGITPNPASLGAWCRAPESCSRTGCQGATPPPLGSILRVFDPRCWVPARAPREAGSNAHYAGGLLTAGAGAQHPNPLLRPTAASPCGNQGQEHPSTAPVLRL